MKIIFRSMAIASLMVLFMTTATFAHQDGTMGSGMMQGKKSSGMMKPGGKESDTSGRQGRTGMGSGMMGSRMMKGMMGSGMMKGYRRMMGAGDIPNLLNHGDKLSLTDEQMAALKSLEFSLAKKIILKKADLQVAAIDLEGLLSQDKVNMPKVESKLKQIQDLRTEIWLSQIKARIQAKKVLTGKQRQVWKSLGCSK